MVAVLLLSLLRGEALVVTLVFLDRSRNVGDGIFADAVLAFAAAVVGVSGTAAGVVGDGAALSREEPVGDAREGLLLSGGWAENEREWRSEGTLEYRCDDSLRWGGSGRGSGTGLVSFNRGGGRRGTVSVRCVVKSVLSIPMVGKVDHGRVGVEGGGRQSKRSFVRRATSTLQIGK